MSPMTSRQRVLAALNHQQPDRVPVDVGGSSASTIVGEAYERLKAQLGVAEETRYMKLKSRTTILAEPVAQRLHSDTRPLVLRSPDGWQDIVHADGSFTDYWGVTWSKPQSDGHYIPSGSPLRDATLAGLDRYPWPDPLNPGRVRGLREQARRLHEETDCAIVLSMPVGFVHQSQYLRGYENYLVDLLLNPEFVEALMDRTLDFWLRLAEAVLQAVDPYVDVVLMADDVAFHDRPMVDLQRYRRMIKPRHARMVALIKRMSRAKVLYHCCGSVKALIPDFVEIGIDVLNPVQVSSAGMDTAELKALYGDRLCFWGAIDTSRVLPYGSPEDVRAEVARRIRDLAAGGGYVLAAVHNIQEDVPPENILAMTDAACECAVPAR
ncbi:MAG: uroporphyrinogen decarboxylase family protein [Nitrososphaerales archaeon]